MAEELIRPIDPDSARAIEEAAKAASQAIGAAVRSGEYVGSVLGDLPNDLVGMIGDWVKHKRLRRWIELQAETAKILRDRNIDNREDVSPSIAIPLIDAALNEDREGLKQLWSKLLASAMDSDRANLVRPSLIELLKNLDPLDARILQVRGEHELGGQGDLADRIMTNLQVDRDQAFYSLEHLYELGCLDEPPNAVPVPRISAKARLLIRAVR